MNWFDWVLILALALSAISNIAIIGKERKPVTSLAVAINTLLMGLLIAGIVYY